MTSPYTAVNEVRTTRDELIAAKALITDPAMWGKGSWFGDDGRMCAIGALRKTTGVTTTFCGEPESLLLLQLPGRNHWGSVEDYNDHPDTTHADIMSLFDRAIASAESSS